MIRTSVQGSFPKIPSGSGPSVRSAISRFEKRAISPRELYDIYNQVTYRVLNLAHEAGIDLTTDGQIRWNDMFDPVVRDLDNVHSSGLLRLFDNNFYYRHPVVTGRLQFQGGTLRSWTHEASNHATVPLKVALPGPFTFMSLSEDKNYQNPVDYLHDLVDVLRMEADSLADTGIVEVQWDEPVLAVRDDYGIEHVTSILKKLTQDAPISQSVSLYWGKSVSRWIEPLSTLPIQRLYLDAVEDPSVVNVLAEREVPVEVGIGILDARNVRPENLDDVAKFIEKAVEKQGVKSVWLHPNSGLELLPPDRATQKVLALGALKNLINGQKG